MEEEAGWLGNKNEEWLFTILYTLLHLKIFVSGECITQERQINKK